jgi:hypothetical protein
MPTYLKPKPKITDKDFMTTLLPLSTKTPTVSDHPEVELLLCCARTHIGPETAARIRTLLQQDINWAYLIQTAAHHGVMPLLYCSLNTTCPEAVPKAILSQLRNHFHSNAFRNLFLTKELLLLLNLFESNGIKAIPFKGSVLAAWVYGNLALRQFGDLDILVSRQDYLKTKNLLISQGYYELPLNLNWEAQMVHEKSRVNVDLHWGITPIERPFKFNFERLWSRLEPVSLAGTTVKSLSSEDLLLILCVQIARNCWEQNEQLSQICDISELLRVHPAMDWEHVIKQASKLGGKRMLFFGLLLASSLLGTALPKEISPTVQADAVVKALVEQVCSRLLSAEYEVRNELEEKRFYLQVRERLQDKLPYFLGRWLYFRIVPTPQDWAFLALPDSLSSLYYLVKPIRLLGKWGLNPVKRLLGF